MRNFDPAYFTSASQNLVYYPSSADNAIHALNALTGKETWVFFTEAPVRFPPTIYKNLAIFGSDDGHVYAVNKDTGKQIYKIHAAPENRRIPSNGKWISPWPVRSSVLVQHGKAYFAASLVPWEISYLHCIDAATGRNIYTTEHKDITIQGALLSNKDRLYAPQGRAVPLVFDIKTGKTTGTIAQAGGTFALIDDDGNFFAGPNNQHSKDEQLRAFNPENSSRIATFNDTNRLVVSANFAYLHSEKKLKAFDLAKSKEIQAELSPLQNQLTSIDKQLKKKPENADDLQRQRETLNQQIKVLNQKHTTCWIWDRAEEIPYDLIATPTKIIAGFNNRVAIIDQKTGKQILSIPVDGKAHGLSIINNTLIVSTHKGTIQAFK